ncbi:MAG: tol-pal system protein YbgF [Phenylobacterium sp.]|jgi:tol-pal system protein YbgF
MKMLKKVLAFGFAIGSTVVSAANAPVTDLSTTTMDDRLATLERLMQARNQSQLGIQQQLDTLLEEVNELRGATEEHGHKLEQLVERQRELYQELENRYQAPQTTQPEVAATEAVGAEVGEYTGTVGENEAYDAAVNLVLKDRRYDEAVKQFRAFITNFPTSAYAPNAYYWLGQLLFNKGNYPDAKAQFDQVVNYYPDSNKRADALLKLGAIALKRNDKTAAKVLFEKVVAEYPGSTSAKLAAERLKQG